jgi:hypothetical protein
VTASPQPKTFPRRCGANVKEASNARGGGMSDDAGLVL